MLAAAVVILGVGVPACGEDAVHAETPDATGMTVFFGSTHVHTGLNNDHGSDRSTTYDNLAAAKSSKFDFVMLTEHSGRTGPPDPAAYYADAQKQAAALSEDGTFVALVGYEYSDNNGDGDTDNGHMNAIGTEAMLDAMAPGNTFRTLEDYLVQQSSSRPVFGGFNHPPATGHGGAAPANLTPAIRKLIVMTETSNKVSYNATDEANYYKSFVAELDAGWMVAPTCGLDSHGLVALKQTETASKKPCRTGLLAPSLTKANVIDAMMQRRIYSTRDINLRFKYSVNGHWMGSAIGKPATAAFTITVKDQDTSNAADKIKKIEVIGSRGAVLASQTFDAHTVSWQPSVAVGANKYMFVRVFNGERSAHTAVGAPVWFE